MNDIKLNPPAVRVELPVSQQVSYKEVGIRPVIQGKLAPGYFLEPVEVNPPSATLVGEPSQLAAVASVETEPIDVNGLSATAVRQVSLRAPRGLSFLQQRPVTVTLETLPPRRVRVVVTDRAPTYNPLLRPEVDTTLPLDERPIGGLGVHLVKRLMDATSYERRDGQNILTMELELDREE